MAYCDWLKIPQNLCLNQLWRAPALGAVHWCLDCKASSGGGEDGEDEGEGGWFG